MKILCFAGSARKESFNKALAKIINTMATNIEYVESQFIDLADYSLPLYDGDLESEKGLPDNVIKLKELFKSVDAFIIACPEYNSSITPLLKNVLDWVSRPATKDEPALIAYQGKKAALVSASPGGLGGLRGLVTVRSLLSNIGVWVAPTQVAIPKVHEVIHNAQINDERTLKSLQKMILELVA